MYFRTLFSCPGDKSSFCWFFPPLKQGFFRLPQGSPPFLFGRQSASFFCSCALGLAGAVPRQGTFFPPPLFSQIPDLARESVIKASPLSFLPNPFPFFFPMGHQTLLDRVHAVVRNERIFFRRLLHLTQESAWRTYASFPLSRCTWHPSGCRWIAASALSSLSTRDSPSLQRPSYRGAVLYFLTSRRSTTLFPFSENTRASSFSLKNVYPFSDANSFLPLP